MITYISFSTPPALNLYDISSVLQLLSINKSCRALKDCFHWSAFLECFWPAPSAQKAGAEEMAACASTAKKANTPPVLKFLCTCLKADSLSCIH